MGDEYGLIGYPLPHSFSPAYFAEKFLREGIDATYTAFPLEDIGGLKALLGAHPQLRGFNVTTPHKTSIIPFLQSRHEDVVNIGACNCVKITQSGLVGYNTDWKAFYDSLKPLLNDGHHQQALVLGNGGAAKAVVFALKKLDIPFRIATRAGTDGATALNDVSDKMIRQYSLIINTTPLGMYPDEALAPEIPYGSLTPSHLLYDLIYNPTETLFLKKGKEAGAVIKNGQEMLERQAEYSWEIWQH